MAKVKRAAELYQDEEGKLFGVFICKIAKDAPLSNKDLDQLGKKFKVELDFAFNEDKKRLEIIAISRKQEDLFNLDISAIAKNIKKLIVYNTLKSESEG